MKTRKISATFLWVLAIIMQSRQTSSIHSVYMSKVDELSYVVDGDVMLGIATVLTRFDDETPCGETITRTGMTYLQAMIYGIRKINEDPNLLANISLGVVATDSCAKDQITIARSLQLLPESAFKCGKDACPKTSEDIVGVIGDVFNPSTIILAKFFQLFQIPLVSPFATSNQLSNKKEYPYFLRVLPPTKYEIQSILEIIRYFNWTYVSAIFMDDDSGRDGEANLKDFADDYGICVAYSTFIRRRASPEDLEAITLKLSHKSKARVVILLGDHRTIQSILDWARESGRMGNFIWIISRNYNPDSDYYNDTAGAFVADMDVKMADGFWKDYMSFTGRHQDIANLPTSWYHMFIEDSFDCSFDSSSDKLPCATFLDTPFSNMTSPVGQRNLFSKAMDGVYLYAHGLDRLIKENCDDARIYKEKLKDCVKGPLLYKYMKNATFEGVGGKIALNENGDNVEEFFISQWQYDDKGIVRRVKIAKWLMDTSGIEVYPENIGWYREGRFRQDFPAPSSVCSVECQPNEFKIQLDQKCCWECKACHPEERLVRNGTECEMCPEFTWANQTHYRTCDDIEPVFLTWFDAIGVSLTIIAAIGVSTTTFVLILYVLNRKERLIKASSRELSMIMGIGLLISYLSVYPVIAKPTLSVCWVQRLSFSITYAMVFSPMLVRSSRIYRIFAAGNAGNRRPKLISTRSQLVFTTVAILVQVALSLVTAVFWPPTPLLQMPVRSEPFVELLCHLPGKALTIPLSYNILLVAVSAFHGWKTRKLPENFNESRYIFLSVSTTLFIWIAFLPTYFSAFHSKQKAMLLALTLIINSSVILLCLFIPKVYSIYYVNEGLMNIGTSTTQQPSMVGRFTTRVHPATINTTSANPSHEFHSNSRKPSEVTSTGSGAREARET